MPPNKESQLIPMGRGRTRRMSPGLRPGQAACAAWRRAGTLVRSPVVWAQLIARAVSSRCL